MTTRITPMVREAGLIRTVRYRNAVLHSPTNPGTALLNSPKGTGRDRERPTTVEHRTLTIGLPIFFSTQIRRGRVVSLEDLLQQAMRIHDLYDELNLQERGRVWTQEEFMLGFVGDVGDLAKLVMAEAGAREMPGGRTALEHELADCLWSVLILAHRYDIDLEAAFRRTMAELDTAISARLPKDDQPW
ncbi:MazG nucleotide pyrophosphohydrolase domain-containing protein [Streptomyces mirabilis]|uniref:MazG nucleotide pyrophosphohydrolase domain-containing protein n=1 Tax=Streptomyces mirabilis TaxID=68239 RepID=UPI0036A2E74C